MFPFSAGRREAVATIAPESYNAQDDTVRVVWLTDPEAIEQTRSGQLYRCILDTDPANVDLSDANRGQSVINGHWGDGLESIIGVTVPATTALAGGRGESVVKLSDLPADLPITDKIRRGFANRVSLKWEATEPPVIERPVKAGDMMTVLISFPSLNP